MLYTGELRLKHHLEFQEQTFIAFEMRISALNIQGKHSNYLDINIYLEKKTLSRVRTQKIFPHFSP